MFLDRGKSEIDKLLIPDKINSLSLAWIGAIFVGTAFYSAPTKIGDIMSIGLIPAIIFIIFFSFVTFYTMTLVGRSVIATQQDTSSRIWKVNHPKTVIIPSMMLFFPTLGELMYMYNRNFYYFNLFMQKLSVNTGILNDYFFISAIFTLILVPGVMFRQDDFYFRILVILKIIVLTGILVVEIAHLISTGVDTKNMIFFEPRLENLVGAYNTLTLSFCFMMFYLISLTQMQRITIRRINDFNRLGCIIISVITLVFAIIHFLDVGSLMENGMGIDELYEDGSIEQQILIFLCFALSFLYLPLLLIPAAKALLGAVHSFIHFPKDIWALTSLAIALISMFLGKLDGEIFRISFFVIEILLALLYYIFPVAMFLSSHRHPSAFDIFGCGVIIFLFVIYIISHVAIYYIY